MKKRHCNTTSDEEPSAKRAARDRFEATGKVETALSADEGHNLAVRWLGLLDLTTPETEITLACESSKKVEVIDLTNE
jgi:hypothetical protein